jgi:hypothetical protein
MDLKRFGKGDSFGGNRDPLGKMPQPGRFSTFLQRFPGLAKQRFFRRVKTS